MAHMKKSKKNPTTKTATSGFANNKETATGTKFQTSGHSDSSNGNTAMSTKAKTVEKKLLVGDGISITTFKEIKPIASPTSLASDREEVLASTKLTYATVAQPTLAKNTPSIGATSAGKKSDLENTTAPPNERVNADSSNSSIATTPHSGSTNGSESEAKDKKKRKKNNKSKKKRQAQASTKAIAEMLSQAATNAEEEIERSTDSSDCIRKHLPVSNNHPGGRRPSPPTKKKSVESIELSRERALSDSSSSSRGSVRPSQRKQILDSSRSSSSGQYPIVNPSFATTVIMHPQELQCDVQMQGSYNGLTNTKFSNQTSLEERAYPEEENAGAEEPAIGSYWTKLLEDITKQLKKTQSAGKHQIDTHHQQFEEFPRDQDTQHSSTTFGTVTGDLSMNEEQPVAEVSVYEEPTSSAKVVEKLLDNLSQTEQKHVFTSDQLSSEDSTSHHEDEAMDQVMTAIEDAPHYAGIEEEQEELMLEVDASKEAEIEHKHLTIVEEQVSLDNAGSTKAVIVGNPTTPLGLLKLPNAMRHARLRFVKHEEEREEREAASVESVVALATPTTPHGILALPNSMQHPSPFLSYPGARTDHARFPHFVRNIEDALVARHVIPLLFVSPKKGKLSKKVSKEQRKNDTSDNHSEGSKASTEIRSQILRLPCFAEAVIGFNKSHELWLSMQRDRFNILVENATNTKEHFSVNGNSPTTEAETKISLDTEILTSEAAQVSEAEEADDEHTPTDETLSEVEDAANVATNTALPDQYSPLQVRIYDGVTAGRNSDTPCNPSHPLDMRVYEGITIDGSCGESADSSQSLWGSAVSKSHTVIDMKQQASSSDSGESRCVRGTKSGSSPRALESLPSRPGSREIAPPAYSVCGNRADNQKYKAENTFIGVASLVDLLEALDWDLSTGRTDREKVARAFTLLSRKEKEIYEGVTSDSLSIDPLKSPRMQHRAKLGGVSLYHFLQSILFDLDDETTVLEVRDAFERHARLEDQGLSDKLSTFFKLDAASDFGSEK